MQRIEAHVDEDRRGHHLRRKRQIIDIGLHDLIQRERATKNLQCGIDLADRQIALGGLKDDRGAIVDQTVAITPGDQFTDAASPLQGHVLRDLIDGDRSAKHRPHILSVLSGELVQRDLAFPEIVGYAAIDDLHLTRLALECRVEFAAEHRYVFLIDQHQAGVLPREIRKDAITVGQLVDQNLAFPQYAIDLPVGPRIQHLQIDAAPTPGCGERAHQFAPPTDESRIIRRTQSFVDLEIKAAPHEIEAIVLGGLLQILFDGAV